MEYVWNIKRKREDYNDLDTIIEDMFIERFGYRIEEERSKKLYNPFLFKNINLAIDKIISYLSNNRTICIYGDYDVDGITSIYVAGKMLRIAANKLNSKSKISCYIPDREHEGYGLNKTALFNIKHTKKADLVITVDCGISNYEEIEYGKSIGLDFIVTDHHELPSNLPNVICVTCKDGQYPFPYLSGCGVVYKLLLGLFIKLNIDLNKAYEFIDIVALSTLADMVELIDENRIIVQHGLKLLNENFRLNKKERLWIKKLISNSSYSDTPFIDVFISTFIIAPRMNSVGRLKHAKDVIDYMLTEEENEITEKSLEIEEINNQRKDIQAQYFEMIDKELSKQEIPEIITYVTDAPVGVIGLVASNLINKYHRPTIIFTDKGDKLKGSMRSIEGVHCYKDLILPAKEYLLSGGGHALAGGISLKKENFEKVKNIWEEKINEKISKVPNLLQPKIDIETELYVEDINLDFYEKLKVLEPHGMGNEKPHFLLKDAQIQQIKLMPIDNPKHIEITVNKDNKILSFVYFNSIDRYDEINEARKCDIVFDFNINNWNGKTSLKLEVLDISTK